MVMVGSESTGNNPHFGHSTEYILFIKCSKKLWVLMSTD